MKLKGGFTPKQAALSIALGWLKAVHDEKTDDIYDSGDTPSQRKKLKEAVAKLHNRLLGESDLDGQNIGED